MNSTAASDCLTPKRIGLVVFENVIASHVTGAADAFGAAFLDDGFGNRLPCYEIVTIGLSGEYLRSDSGMVFRANKTLRNAPPCDTIIVPGSARLPSAEWRTKLAVWLLKQARRTRRLASICSGVYALAETGLLDGRKVATHWRFATGLAARFPALKVNYKTPVLRDGRFYTAAGVIGGMELALAMIEEDYGRYVALAVRRELMTFLNQEGSVAVLPGESAVGNSESVERFAEVVAWVMRNLQEDLSVEVLARRACMAPRYFSRAFKSVFGTSPAAFVENLRLNEARRRLARRRRSLRSVAASVGFDDPGRFRRAFARRFGETPKHTASAATANSEAGVGIAA